MTGKKGTYVEIHFLAKKFKTYFVMIHPSFHDDTSKFKTRMSQGLNSMDWIVLHVDTCVYMHGIIIYLSLIFILSEF